MKRNIMYLAGTVAASAVALGAYAAKAAENDAMAISTAKIGLQQAVANAEGHVGGKATRAEFERKKDGKWVFDVEVVKGATVIDVSVDASSGNVLAAVVDQGDKDDKHDRDD